MACEAFSTRGIIVTLSPGLQKGMGAYLGFSDDWELYWHFGGGD